MKDINSEEKILEAALDVVKKKTISGTRMHLIAKEVDMVQSNLHYYFKTKEELMSALQDKVLRRCHELRSNDKRKTEDTLEAQLRVFVNQKRQFILKEQKYDFAEVDFWVQARCNEKMKQAFMESYDGWRNDIREILEKYSPHLSEKKKKYIPYLMVSMLEGATIQYLIDEGGFDLDYYFDICIKNIMLMLNETENNN